MVRILFGVTVPATAQAFLQPQLSALVCDGWDVHLVCSPDQGVEELFDTPGVTLHCIPMMRNPSPFKDLVSLYRWVKLIRQINPDIIVGSTPKAALLSMTAGRLCGTLKRVYHARGLRAQGLKGAMKQVALFAERQTVRASTVVLCDSESLRDALVESKCLHGDTGVVLGAGSCCGVDTDFFRPPTGAERRIARDELNICKCDFVIGFVGRVTEDKGIRELIQAADLVKEHHGQVKLVVVGPNEFTTGSIRDLTTLGFVNYLGPRKDVRSVYWALDVFALPSYREGFPIAPLEAQACGLPLITTSVTGCIDSQAPDNKALLIPAHNVATLAHAITLLVNEPERRSTMGIHARNWVASNFRVETVTQRQIDFLREQVTR